MLRFVLNNLGFLSAGALLTLNSSFGQTFFISLFAAQILASFDLTDGSWGLIYTAATTLSAVAMFWAGALTDTFRARVLAMIVMPGLALTCVMMGTIGSVAGLFFVIFFLRFLGQGMMYQLATVSMARWFSARRGLALSLTAMGFWFGHAVIPPVFGRLLSVVDWTVLWYVAAGFVMICFPAVLWLLRLERSPTTAVQDTQSVGMGGKHWNRTDVLRSGLFWMLLPMLLGPPAWGTAVVFQQVHIASVKGWPLVDYLTLLPIMASVSVAATLTTGSLIDRFSSGRLLRVYPLVWMVGFAILSTASTLSAALVAFLVFGVATGMQGTLITAFWAEYFGTRHIGSIKATSSSVMVFGSAIGPGISGLLIDAGLNFPTQMYGIAAYFAFAAVLVSAILAKADRALPAKVDVKRT